MKIPRSRFALSLPLLATLLISLMLPTTSARADFNLSVSLDQFGSTAESGGVTYGIFLGLNTTNTPITYDEVYSPSSNSFTGVGTGSSFNVLSLPNYNALLNELTNGTWKLIVNVGDPSQKTYLFHVNLTGLNSNSFANIEIFDPPYFSTNIATTAVFSFTGPSNYQSLNVVIDQGNNYFDSASLTPGTTNWTPNNALGPNTSYSFYIDYTTDGSSLLNYSVPTTAQSQTLPGWSTSIQLILQDNSQFTTAPPLPLDLQSALDATNLTWTTSGDASWFAETNVSFDGVSAAQSGVLQDEQQSTLQTTVTGPGTISFYWQTAGESDEFDLLFDDNGGYVTDIGSQTPWSQYSYALTPGQHILTWIATSGDGSSTDDAANLDEVVFTPQTGPLPPLGSWASTGSMPLGVPGRGEFTLTTLPNGKVLAAGGLIAGFPEVSSSEGDLFIPATGIWTNDAYMNVDRRQHTATLLNNGKVLVTGGFSGTLGSGATTNSSAELFDPVANTWTITGSMHTPRADHAATLLNNGLVLVAGGLTTSTAELYNPTNQTWSNTGSLNESRFGATLLTLPNGQAMILGGASDNTAELYNPSTGLWSYSNPMLAEQVGATATLLTNGTVLVAGGANSGGNQTGFAEIYDPSTGNWTLTGAMGTPRGGAASVLLSDGVVLVAGGNGASGNTLTNSELYSPVTDQWTPTGPMLEARSDGFLTVLLHDGRALATGGFSSTAELYTTVGFVLPVPIVLTHPTRLAGSFQFSWTNMSGSTNMVFASTNVAQPFSNWLNLGTAAETPASSGQFQFTDTAAGSNIRRFYRVVSP